MSPRLIGSGLVRATHWSHSKNSLYKAKVLLLAYGSNLGDLSMTRMKFG
ncbi:hypothetical protein OIU76_029573 [Salix suchowensis]|nr:hypothetical protein OIU76_029573 [Salix suchowensis]